MLKFLSEMTGLKILLFQERALLSHTKDYLIEAETGTLVGFYTKAPRDKKTKVILARDIKGMGTDFLLVDSLDSLTDSEEVVRVVKAEEVNPKLVKERVVTEGGQYLGKIRDVTIDLSTLKIAKLYVTPTRSLEFFTKELIIPSSQIHRIEKDKIIVKDSVQKIKHGVLANQPKPAIS